MEAQVSDSDIPNPKTLADVEKLVQELYQPGAPQKIAKIQEALQRLQRSSDGWQLANSLLESHDEKVKFFGALTFTVKLNLDSKSLNNEDAALILGRIISWILRSLDDGIGSLVVRKLCSTLVVYFLHFSASWTMCIRHLICCLSANEALSVASIDQAPSTGELMQSLSIGKVLALLWFSTALAEEVGKTDANNIKFHKFHESLRSNVEDAVAVITSGLSSGPSANGSAENPQTLLRRNAIICFHSWVLYSHRAFIDAGITLEDLKVLTKPALACIVQNDVYEETIELFSDILGNYSKFLNDDDLHLMSQLLNSEWSKQRYSRLVQGDFMFDSIQYGQLMIAFGDATVQNLARSNNSESQELISALEGLLHAEGYAVAEDLIFVQALEFWATFVEVMVDSLYSEQEDPELLKTSQAAGSVSSGPNSLWFARARAHVMQAVEHCWLKIQFPPLNVFEEWDSVDRTGFNDARNDVADFLQSSYTLTGNSLFSLFVTMTINSLEGSEWAQLEASLFCLGTLADCVDDDPAYESMLGTVFGSQLFIILADPSTSTPARTRQTTLWLIAQYDGYFERHKDHLAAALTFLFRALSSDALAHTASRSIHSLCSSCRQVLTAELSVFLQQYAELTTTRHVDGLVKERIVGAIAAITQALPRDHDRIEPLSKLLLSIQSNLEICLSLHSQGMIDEAEASGLEALRCLTSIGKGLQVPSDVPVDLDDTPSSGAANQFRTVSDGSAIQGRVQDIIRHLMLTFPNSGELIEAACCVFRAGFAETVPGPFVFPPERITEFLLNFTIQSPRLGAVMSTACALVSSYASGSSENIQVPLQNLVAWALSILQGLGDPANDPEVSQNGIDFAYRLIPQYVGILLKQPSSSMQHFFMFSLKAMTGRDPLPKAAASDFWSAFVSMANLPAPLAASTEEVMEHYGPFLAQALVYNISGNAARSELDKISDPLKKLVVRQVKAKSWLENALSQQNDHENKSSESEKRIFLQKIISLRGARQTNQVVKDFWLTCRGSSFAYAS